MKKTLSILILITGMILLGSQAIASETYGIAIDPTYIGVGARPLGMGKAYVALAEDASTIFVNPAALARVNEVLFSSMYSNLMSDINYSMASATFPLGPGTAALGYLGVTMPGIELYTDDPLLDPVPAGTADYNNTILYASYGARLESINPDIMVGANLKSFFEGFSGSDLTANGSGTGMNLDLGLLYQPLDWFAVGLTQQNFISAGKIKFANGVEEDMPSLTKLGMSVTVFGKYGFVRSPYKLTIASDVDMGQGDGKCATLHLGAEFWPTEMLAIRAGVDQDPIPAGVSSNLTAGVGLRLGNIQFDYAYHAYYDIPENTTNFFSISLVGPFDQRRPRSGFAVQVDNPKDDVAMTYADKVNLEGAVLEQMPGDRIEVNGSSVQLNEKGMFSSVVLFNSLGAKKILVKAFDTKGNSVTIEKTVLRLASFKDVTGNYWAKSPIEMLATAGLVTGYPGGTFMPDRTLTRAELATLLVRAKGMASPAEEKSTFSDVASDHWAKGYIEAAVASGLVKGYPDKTYRPDAKISRAEGVTVLARLEGLESAAEEAAEDVSDERFTDISASWAAGFIVAADDAGLLVYMENDTKFNPNAGFTRAEAVEILSKTTLGEGKVSAMLSGSGLEELGMIIK